MTLWWRGVSHADATIWLLSHLSKTAVETLCENGHGDTSTDSTPNKTHSLKQSGPLACLIAHSATQEMYWNTKRYLVLQLTRMPKSRQPTAVTADDTTART